MATVSTMWDKHMNTGGQGGVVFTRDEELYRRSRRASDRGKPFFLPDGSTNEAASLNVNLSDLAGAIGRTQVAKLPAQVERRREVVGALEAGIADLGLESVTVLQPIPGAVPSYWWLPVRVNSERLGLRKGHFRAGARGGGGPGDGHGVGAHATPDGLVQAATCVRDEPVSVGVAGLPGRRRPGVSMPQCRRRVK